MRQIVLTVLIISLFEYEVNSSHLPGPLVYVVTPSPRTPQSDKGRSAPFYYHNWMRRMDAPSNTTTSTTTTEKPKTPDLIFAEFESGNNNMKSIRKLLEKEKIETTTTTTTTSRPIYVPDEEEDDDPSNYGIPEATTEKSKKTDMTDYFAYYNNLYNTGHQHSPIYEPPSSSSVVPTTSSAPITTTTMQPPMDDVQNIWHIIDSEKYDQNSVKWEEESINSEHSTKGVTSEINHQDVAVKSSDDKGDEDGMIDENFALPGFGTTPGNGAENESRAIRTEPNMRFPYINLKPFQMKSSKNPLLNSFSSNKKGANNMFNLDSFHEVKSPVRGEAQDIISMHQPVDRYNPAQPYLPHPPTYGSKSKQSNPPSNPSPPPRPPPSAPVSAVANLVPPPPPPTPRITADDFPTPSTYESFPPYAPAAPGPRPLALSPPVTMYQPSSESRPDSSEDSASDSLNDSDSPSMDLGYRYKPPSPPIKPFAPTLPPPLPSKPFSGYSYDKPPMVADSPPPMMDMGSKPEFHGYHYQKPEPTSPPQDHPPASYGHHDAPPPSYQPDYPELIFDKPHGGDMKGGNDMNINSMGMMPPPPPSDMKPDMDPHGPPDDSGFPHDFPGDFKFHHDFDDHDYHHHHHHTTTTTTTEMPRVNRYSYYYLGKKLYYLPLYFSVYFIIYVGALIIKAVLRHKITYPNSWRPNDQTASFFSKRSVESHLSNDNLHDITGRVTRAIAAAAEKYMDEKSKEQ